MNAPRVSTLDATAPQPPADPAIATALLGVAAINAELSSPQTTAQVNAALQRLAVTQSLATAIQDAVTDLRAHTTLQLSAIAGAAEQLIKSGNVDAWRASAEALQIGAQYSQRRLVELVGLALQTCAPAAPAAATSTNGGS